MKRQAALTQRQLDALVARAEELFAQAIKRAFNAAVVAMQQGVTAAAAEPFVSVDDAQAAQVAWQREMANLTPIISEAFEAGAIGVMGAAGKLNLPTKVAPILNQLAAEHIASSTNRIAHLGDDAWNAVRTSMLEGFKNGESIPKLSARIRREGRLTASRARTIARTEIISASNAGSFQGAKVAPPSIRPRTKEWLATGDDRTRESHLEADGQVVDLDDTFTVGGAQMRYPGDEHAPAEEIVNCRCTILFDTGEEVET